MRPSPWLLLVAVIAVFSSSIVGCRAPLPSFKPYSNTRVPPPQTGAIGGDDYYPNSAPAQPPTTGRKSSSTSLSTDLSVEDGEEELAWTRGRTRTLDSTDDDDNSRIGATIRRNPSEGGLAGHEEEPEYDSAIRTADYETDENGTYQPGSTRTRRRSEGVPLNDATGTWKAR